MSQASSSSNFGEKPGAQLGGTGLADVSLWAGGGTRPPRCQGNHCARGTGLDKSGFGGVCQASERAVGRGASQREPLLGLPKLPVS